MAEKSSYEDLEELIRKLQAKLKDMPAKVGQSPLRSVRCAHGNLKRFDARVSAGIGRRRRGGLAVSALAA
jgi:hypothetical protein